MATVGPLTATAASSVADAISGQNSNAWVSPANALTGPDATSNSDTTHAASITAATFDSPDKGELLFVTGFDTSNIPAGSSVTAVQVDAGAFFTTGQGSGSISYVGLVAGGTVQGNQLGSPVALTGTFTDSYSFGGAGSANGISGMWGQSAGKFDPGSGNTTALDKANVGFAIGMQATAANADVFIDYVAITVTFTQASANTPMTITATQTANGANGMYLEVYPLLNAAPAAAQTGAVLNASPAGAPGFDQSVTTTTTGSVVFGAMTQSTSSATAFTADALTTIVDDVPDSTNGKRYGFWYATSATGTPGATTLGSTTPATAAGAYAAAEILAGASAITVPAPTSAQIGRHLITAGQTVSVTGFSAPPGSLLVALVCSSANGAGGTLGLSMTGGNLNWVPLAFEQPAGVNGAAAVFIADVATVAAADPVVTATQQGSNAQLGMAMRVYVLTNADAAQAGAGTGTQSGAAAHEVTLTAATAGSGVYGAAVNRANTSFTADAQTTTVDNIADSFGRRYGTFKASALTTGPGSVTAGFSAPANDGAAAAAEITSTGGTLTEDVSSPGPASGTSVTSLTSDVFSPPEPSLLVALISSRGGNASDPSCMAVTGFGLTWTETVRANGTASPDGGYAGVWTAAVPDAVIQAGTPLGQRFTSSPAAGAWGTGQNRTAGNLLVAIVTADATTSSAAVAQNTGTTGWTNQVEKSSGTTNNSRVSVWTKTAAGADAAPAFTSALSGTAAMTIVLYEFTGADTSSPVDTSGVYGSGNTSATVSPSATTGATVTTAGAFGLSVFTQERAATTVTWTELGTGWSSAYSDGATSSVAHTQVNSRAGVAQGATVSDSGRFSTRTTAFAAGAVVVIRAAAVPVTPSIFPATAGNPVNVGRENPVILSGD